jgi:lactate dehydrogenase-like 2-hydroxyacid dehydrogenase
MKPTALLINTARGDIVDESALIEALKNGSLGGYATDVLSGELDFKEEHVGEHPLVRYAREHRDVIIVPHIGGMTQDARAKTDIFIAQKLRESLK